MILITGAGGNVGRSLLDELVAAGRPARAAFQSADKTARAKTAGRDAVTIDFANPTPFAPRWRAWTACSSWARGGWGRRKARSTS